jgi:Rho GTPase-activating protein 1
MSTPAASLQLYDEFVRYVLRSQGLIAKLSGLLSSAEADSLSAALVDVAVSYRRFFSLAYMLLEEEFKTHRSDPWAILRGNSLVCKVLDAYSRQSGGSFLSLLVGPLLREVASDEELSFEIDPLKIRGSPAEIQVRLTEHELALSSFCGRMLDTITSDESFQAMPIALRNIAGLIGALSADYHFDETPLIGGFVMLRLFNPVIVFPERFSILSEAPNSALRRNLILVSKILQNLANGVVFGQKEAYMERMNPFIEERMEQMAVFLKRFRMERIEDLLNDDVIHEAVDASEPGSIVDSLMSAEVIYKIISNHRERLNLAEVDSFASRISSISSSSSSSTTTTTSSSSSSSSSSASATAATSSSSTRNVSPTGRPENHEYMQLLRRSQTLNLSDIEDLKILQRRGLDAAGRPVLLLVAENLPARAVDMERVLMYVLRELDRLGTREYSVVYVHTNFNSDNKPEFAWLKRCYTLLSRNIRKNVKALYIVHPTFWIKLIFSLFRPVISAKFSKKLIYIDRLHQLETHLPGFLLPFTICSYDMSLQPNPDRVPVFGVALESYPEVPPLLDRCIKYVQTRALTVEGIFRLAPSFTEQQLLKEMVDRGYHVDLHSISDPHLVASLLKVFLRELPEPVVPSLLYDDFVSVVLSQPPLEPEAKVERLRWLVHDKLPRKHSAVLDRIIHLCTRVSTHAEVTRMGAENMAIVMGPCLLWQKDASAMSLLQSSPMINKVVELLIVHYEAVFVKASGQSRYSRPRTVRYSEKEDGLSDLSALQAMLDAHPDASSTSTSTTTTSEEQQQQQQQQQQEEYVLSRETRDMFAQSQDLRDLDALRAMIEAADHNRS